MEAKTCPICQRKVEYLEMHVGAEKQLVEIIKKEHPQWLEPTGLCPKCVEYYRKELEKYRT